MSCHPWNSRPADLPRTKVRLWLTILLWTGTMSGCASLERSVPVMTPSALAWLSNLVGPNADTGPAFDLKQLQPPTESAAVAPQQVLEVTIWDLREAGQPATFPVRISAAQQIEIPLLGRLDVSGRTITEVETAIQDGLIAGEYLVSPRVIVRSLDVPSLKVHVEGAVRHTGLVELTQDTAYVYHALQAAGGLKENAGMQISISRPTGKPGSASAEQASKETGPSLETAHPYVAATESAAVGAGSAWSRKAPVGPPGTTAATRVVQQTNSLQVLSVADPTHESSANEADPSAAHSQQAAGSARSARVKSAEPMRWFDLSQPAEVQQLKQIMLEDGMQVYVQAVIPPVRITGAVNKPGIYRLPAGRPMNANNALNLAGGVISPEIEYTITILRPARDGRPAQRLQDVYRAGIPLGNQGSVLWEPGDVVLVEEQRDSKLNHWLNAWKPAAR